MRGVEDTGGVYLVPAFVGPRARRTGTRDARGLLIGLTRGTGLPEIARATIESIAYQVHDVVEAMTADRGGAARRSCGWTVGRPATTTCCSSRRTSSASRSSGRGSPRRRPGAPPRWPASRSGSGASLEELAAIRAVDRRFEPAMAGDRRRTLLRGWHRAVERSRGWATGAARRSPAGRRIHAPR